MLLLSIPCFIWQGTYFWIVGVILALSGGMRFFMAHMNVALQKRSLPRQGHGTVILIAGAVMWLAYDYIR